MPSKSCRDLELACEPEKEWTYSEAPLLFVRDAYSARAILHLLGFPSIMKTAQEFRAGQVIDIEGHAWIVLKTEFNKSGQYWL